MPEDQAQTVGRSVPRPIRSVAGATSKAWSTALVRAIRWADQRDLDLGAVSDDAGGSGEGASAVRATDGLDADLVADLHAGMPLVPSAPHESTAPPGMATQDESTTPTGQTRRDKNGVGPGTPASVWALAKAALNVVGAPVTLPTLTVAALRTAKITSARIATYPDHLHALAEGTEPPLPGHRVHRAPADVKYLITSDLHRCVPGRVDWPERQDIKGLYADVLHSYNERGWHLIENGDVEDFWMVGGSTWGAVYDVAYLTGAVGPADAKRTVLRQHLDRIVDNNAPIYDLLRETFCADGRYLRTMGNHDDAYTDPLMVEALNTHLPGVEVHDNIVLTRPGSATTDGIDGVAAFVAHGHLTDSWNGPGFAPLGRSITWLITGLDDLPGLPKVDGLPDEQAFERLITGGARNRLISVDPRYGGNRRFDSLDESRLFDRLGECAPRGGWPWLLFGHTHFPMLRPLNRSGQQVRYANSGCGVLDGAFSALEWDTSRPEDPLRLVVFTQRGGTLRRVELCPDGPTLRTVSDEPL